MTNLHFVTSFFCYCLGIFYFPSLSVIAKFTSLVQVKWLHLKPKMEKFQLMSIVQFKSFNCFYVLSSSTENAELKFLHNIVAIQEIDLNWTQDLWICIRFMVEESKFVIIYNDFQFCNKIWPRHPTRNLAKCHMWLNIIHVFWDSSSLVYKIFF